MPGAPERSLQLVSPVDRPILVKPKRKTHPGLTELAPRAALRLETNYQHLNPVIIESLAVVMQLHHMLATMELTEVAQEDQQRPAATLEHIRRANRIPFDLVQPGARSALTFLKHSISIRLLKGNA